MIEIYVTNPPYQSQVKLEAHSATLNSTPIAISYTQTGPNYLKVEPITLEEDELKLFWGIPKSTVIGEMGLGIFVNEPSGPKSLMNFEVGFKTTKVTPIQNRFEVHITVGATSVLTSSITHNLPSFNGSHPISCHYESYKIVCTNVGAFSLINYRYFVRAKAYF